MSICAFDELVATFIFFQTWDNSRVRWDNSQKPTDVEAKKIWYSFYWIGPNIDALPCIFHGITCLLHYHNFFYVHVTQPTWHTQKTQFDKKRCHQVTMKSACSWLIHCCSNSCSCHFLHTPSEMAIFEGTWQPSATYLRNQSLKVWSKVILEYEKYGLGETILRTRD